MRSVLLGLVLVSFSAFAGPKTSEPIVVKIKKDHHLPLIDGINGFRHLFDGIYLVFADSPEKVKGQLAEHASTERFYDNRRAQRTELPLAERTFDETAWAAFNDPQASRQWHLKNASEHGISVSRAYTEYGKSQGEAVIVAVVDTGVDYNHPDLKNVMWKNPGEIAGNGVDDDGNGYADDVHGLNFLSRDRQGKPSPDPMDSHSHGTHVSGIIGAEQDNGVGVTGVASNVRIMAIRAVPDDGDETDADVSESFLYAARNGAKVINCSFGKSHKEGDLVYETIRHIGERYGVLVVAAAGNESSDNDRNKTYPASYDNENLLVIASTASGGARSFFSNYGLISVDLGAPGSGIYSTMPNGRYSSMSGTSMASPVAAGVAAEVFSRYPNLSPVQVKDALMRTTTPVNTLQGKTVTGGRIDLYQSLTALKNSLELL